MILGMVETLATRLSGTKTGRYTYGVADLSVDTVVRVL
jgi:hypothetical protein